jgi:hypothetical protein
MRNVLIPISLALIVLTLWDAFESMVFPRRVTRTLRPTRLYYRSTWLLWSRIARWITWPRRRETFLSIFGPLSLLGLFAVWMAILIFAFALLHWALQTPMQAQAIDDSIDFGAYWYLSGSTFFTLGYGDLTPSMPLGRFLAVVESGIGLGFLALVIGYLPALFQAFSRRETTISLLDARAGSPPSAAQFLARLFQARQLEAVGPFLEEWERWAAEVLESHLSFPVLSFYRSQHDNQSWLAALTTILDTCALLLAGIRGKHDYQAQLTFAMARHAVVDIALVFKTPPRNPDPDRLPDTRCRQLRQQLLDAGINLEDSPKIVERYRELRDMYEPFAAALAEYLLLALPPIFPDKPNVDNWQTTAWARRAPGIGKLVHPQPADEHFD